MKLYQITEIKGCPRTKASECSCKDLNKITEAEETVFAMAELEHGDAKGTIKFKQKPGEPTIITGTIKNLTEGTHGFHIHEFGDLSDGCDSAGGHYNPDGVDHGDLEEGHVGDLGNVEADKKGIAIIKIVAERVDLHGPRSVVGRAVVIHADEDDLGKGGDEESLKTGNAGDRVGCGVIRLAEKIDEEYERQLSDKHFNRNELPQIRRKHIKKSDFEYTEGKISIDKIKPVQSQRVDGLSKKAEDVFLKNADRPFIIDKKGYLINGHHRLDAANKLNIERVPAIKIHADIEEVIDEFKHLVSNTKVKEDVVGMNPHAVKPYFSPEEADRANDEWVNQAQVDQEDGVIIKGTDGKQYRIMTSYGNQHFEDGEVYLDGVTDPEYLDKEGYPDAAELLYYHSATGHYPDDEEEIEENIFQAGALAAMLGMSASAMANDADVVSRMNNSIEKQIAKYDANPDPVGRHQFELDISKAALKSVYPDGGGINNRKLDELLRKYKLDAKDMKLYNNLLKLFTASNDDLSKIRAYRDNKKWSRDLEDRSAEFSAKLLLLSVLQQEERNEDKVVDKKGLVGQGMPYGAEVKENFADGKKKGKSRPGRVKRSGASCKGSVTSLRAKAKKYSGERAKMYHWCANMKSGRKKTKENLDLDSDLQGLDRSSKMFKKMVDDKIKSKQIKDMDGIIGYVAQARMAGIITYKEDARDLLQHYQKNKEKIFPQNHLDEIVDPGKTTEVSFNGIRSHIASQYGERYGIYMDNLEFAFDDDFQMTNLGYDEAYIKDNDMAILNNFLKQLPVEFEVVDMRFDDNKDPVFKLAHKQVTRH